MTLSFRTDRRTDTHVYVSAFSNGAKAGDLILTTAEYDAWVATLEAGTESVGHRFLAFVAGAPVTPDIP